MAAKISLSNPTGLHAPASRYSHAALVEGATRVLHISGQVGVSADGTISPDPVVQVEQVLANLDAVLKANGMSRTNIAKVTIFLTDRAMLSLWRERRDAWLGDHPAAASLFIVAGLADPRFLVEAEAEAYA
ncbi:RidA family protein [Muricoccus radiodurans]|uniref:RidA family protein n=1 Tax=Muricoccus radiodurans TaxID=2231721 RepID=UPI003CF01208